MEKKIILCFVLLMMPVYLLGQEKESEQQKLFEDHIISLSIIKPTLTFVPRYHIGYLTNWDDNKQLGLEIGYGTSGAFIGNTENSFYIGDRYRSFYIAPEIRYRIRSKEKSMEYISFEPFLLTHSDRFVNRTTSNYFDRYIFNEESGITNYDSAEYRRTKIGANFNLGVMAYFTPKFGIDFKIGLGVFNRSISFKNVENPDRTGRFFDDEGWSLGTRNYLRDEGDRTSVNLNLDFKLFYKF